MTGGEVGEATGAPLPDPADPIEAALVHEVGGEDLTAKAAGGFVWALAGFALMQIGGFATYTIASRVLGSEGLGVVATFLRFPPTLGNHRWSPAGATLVELGATVAWDLAPGRDLLPDMHTHHRRAVRKAERAGAETRVTVAPTGPDALRIRGRALGLDGDPAKAVVAAWQAQAREVRRIHERLFYRPLLAAAARLSSAETSLSPEQARERFAALGFRDPAGAMRHVEALTAGVSRRAAIRGSMLPGMLGWCADDADPDAGLVAVRRVSDELGTIHWYLKRLRDEGSAAERLAHVLGRSRYAADLLIRAPESVAMLGEPDGLIPRTEAALTQTCLLYTSDAADERSSVDLGGRRIIKKKKK